MKQIIHTTTLLIGMLTASFVYATAYQVGSIKGNFNVSSIGNAVYSIPLDLPPEMNDLIKLSVDYKDGGRPGLFGKSVDLNGLSSISIRPSSLEIHGKIAPIDWRNPKYYLDNTALMQLEESDYYKPHNNPNALYYALKDPTTQAVLGFHCCRPDGLSLNYGNPYGITASSLVNTEIFDTESQSDKKQNIAWALSSIVTPKNRALIINYLEGYEGILIDNICYRHKSQHVHKVFFFYENREEDYYCTNSGKQTKIDKRVQFIDIKTNNTSMRSYHFTYKAGEDYLETVKLVGADGTSFSPTLFSWCKADYYHGQNTTDRDDYLLYDNEQSAGAYKNSVATDYHTQNSMNLPVANLIDFNISSDHSNPFETVTVQEDIIIGDINNDGIDNKILLNKRFKKGYPDYCSRKTELFKWGGIDHLGWIRMDTINNEQGFNKGIITDINKDGENELVLYKTERKEVFFSGTEQSKSYEVVKNAMAVYKWDKQANAIKKESDICLNNLPDSLMKIGFADINGDRVIDLCLKGNSGIYYYRNDGSYTFDSSNLRNLNTEDNKISIHHPSGFTDFNGDGKNDFWSVQKNSNNRNVLHIDTEHKGRLKRLYSLPSYLDMKTIQSADFNGDGKSDFLINNKYLYYSLGNKLELYNSFAGTNSNTANTLFPNHHYIPCIYGNPYYREDRDQKVVADFLPSASFNTFPKNFLALLIKDVDKDGKSDLLELSYDDDNDKLKIYSRYENNNFERELLFEEYVTIGKMHYGSGFNGIYFANVFGNGVESLFMDGRSVYWTSMPSYYKDLAKYPEALKYHNCSDPTRDQTYSDGEYRPVNRRSYYPFSITKVIHWESSASINYPRRLSVITDGLGNTLNIKRQRSDSPEVALNYTSPDINAGNSLYEYTGLRYVVSATDYTGSGGDILSENYQYSKLCFSPQKGNLGVSKRIHSSSYSKQSTEQEFNFLMDGRYTYEKLVTPHLVKTTLVNSEDGHPISTMTYDYKYYNNIIAGCMDYPTLSAQTYTDHLNETSTHTVYTTESCRFGEDSEAVTVGTPPEALNREPYILTTGVTVDNGLFITKKHSNYQLYCAPEGCFYLQKTQSSELKKYADGSYYGVRENYYYSGQNLKSKVSGIANALLPNDKLSISNATKQVTEYAYYDDMAANNYGQVKKVSVRAVRDMTQNTDPYTDAQSPNVITKSHSFIYSASGRFLKSVTDHQSGFSTSYLYDETQGLLTAVADHLGNTATYHYDAWGKLITSTSADGSVSTQNLLWNNAGGPEKAKYYQYTTYSGKSPTWTWYDSFGRTLRTAHYGLNPEKKIFTDTEYNTAGEVVCLSRPYFEGDNRKTEARYNYDDYGRILSSHSPQGNTYYTYGALETGISSPQGNFITRYNKAGQVISRSTNGKTVSYTYHPSGLVKTSTPEGGVAVQTYFDLRGHRTKIDDPNIGIVTNTYNGFGQMLTQSHKGGSRNKAVENVVNTYTYDAAGRLTSTTLTNQTTGHTQTKQHQYDPVSGRLTSITGDTQNLYYYYDEGSKQNLGRLSRMVSWRPGKTFTSQYVYDNQGRISRERFPSGYFVNYNYSTYGHLREVTDRDGRSVWKALNTNAEGQILSEKKGSKQTTFTYNVNRQLNKIYCPSVIDRKYAFDQAGNMTYQEDNNGIAIHREHYTYTAEKQLKSWTTYRAWTHHPNQNFYTGEVTMNYDPGGNIKQKSDLFYEMHYDDPDKAHALTSISGDPSLIADHDQHISYTDFHKVKQVREGNDLLKLNYGVFDQRIKADFYKKGSLELTRYYHGHYEEDHRSGSVKKIHYLSGGNGLAGIYIIADGTAKFYYAYTDYLGSLTTLTNESGTPVEQHDYDPWGNRRALHWEDKQIKPRENIVDRGYTMHEHWDRFKLINMNGRVYDPQLARFLSPDPLLQSPDNHLNFNRYAYCLNNPLRYTDPSGYQYHRIPDGYSWQWINGGWKPVSTSLLSFTVYGSPRSHILSEEDLYLEFGMMSVGEGPSIVEEFLNPPSLLEMVGKPVGIASGGQGATVARVPEKLPVRRPRVVSGGVSLTVRENSTRQPTSHNLATKFFSNTTDAYNYMWKNSFDAKGNPKVEISAWQTSKGIIVMPYYRNSLRASYNDYLPIKTINGQKNVYYDNFWNVIMGHIHTHPSYNNGNIGVSNSDYDMGEWLKMPTTILWNNHLWQLNGRGSTPVNLGTW